MTAWPSLAVRLLLAVALALAPGGSRVLAAAFGPAVQAPAGPAGDEEDDRAEETEAKLRPADRRPDHVLPPTAHGSPFPVRTPDSPRPTAAARPPAADPFRNGLGTPYRC